jgi:hypothetical protein
MRHSGSQVRETLKEAGCRIHQRINAQEVVLIDVETGNLMLYCEKDDFAGHVIEIDGVGYEFCTSVTTADIAKLME